MPRFDRTVFARALTAAAVLIVPVVAFAQGPSGPAIPMGADLKKTAVGAWGEYSLAAGKMPPMKQRFALVGKNASSYTLELGMEGGMMGPTSKAVIQLVLGNDLTKADRIKKMVMQIGAGDPMEMPAGGANIPKDQFGPVDPKKFVDKQDITVPAGTFKTKHYRDKTPTGDGFDYWLSEDVPPFGLVKMEGKISNGPPGMGGAVTMLLIGRGTNAKPGITKTPKPFDAAAVMRQMGQAGGPPPK